MENTGESRKFRRLWATAEQVGEFSKLLIDLGKLIVATFVIGYFLPGVAGEVSGIGFVVGFIVAVGAFWGGLWMLKYKSKFQ